MSATVKIPAQLRPLSGGNAEVLVEGVTSLAELFSKLSVAHPELLERILDENGEIRRFINVYVGDEDVRFLQGLQTQLEDGASVSVLPAIAGG
ncbi:MAG: MoaD/ThiS family protein [Actinomycetota bacterium]